MLEANKHEPCFRPPPTSGLSRRADVLNRSVRIHGLPTDVQDGLLQQALEKLSEGVRRVELFAGTGEATIELDTSAVRVQGNSECTNPNDLKP